MKENLVNVQTVSKVIGGSAKRKEMWTGTSVQEDFDGNKPNNLQVMNPTRWTGNK